MTNMKVPPPVVTGIAIPGDLKITTDSDRYNRQKDIHDRACREVEGVTKTYAKKDKYTTPTSVKVFGGAAALLLLGLTMLFRKGKGGAKKPPIPTPPATP